MLFVLGLVICPVCVHSFVWYYVDIIDIINMLVLLLTLVDVWFTLT